MPVPRQERTVAVSFVDPGQLAAADADPSLAIPLAAALAAVHLFAVRVTFVDGIPRRGVLSLSAGASVSYVFVHLLPEIGHAARTLDEAETPMATVETHAYLVTLLGFVTYYGLERFVRCSRDRPADGEPLPGVFWLHLGSFAVYNGLIGYLLVHRDAPGVEGLALFALAMGLHFLVNDYGLRDHYPKRYHDSGRWVLAAAVLLGTAVGVATAVHPAVTGVLFAFLAGGIVLNVIKEELPEERESHFWAFAAGAGAYAVLLSLV